MKTVTIHWLARHRACLDQRILFLATFGEKVEVSREAILRAGEVGLSLDWFAEHALTVPVLAKYERMTAPAVAKYERMVALSWMEYEEKNGPAMAEEYARMMAPAVAEYARMKALALADVLGL